MSALVMDGGDIDRLVAASGRSILVVRC